MSAEGLFVDNADDLTDRDDSGSSNGLFSMSATDNAEVVSPGVQLGGDGLWSVSANSQTGAGDPLISHDRPAERVEADSGETGTDAPTSGTARYDDGFQAASGSAADPAADFDVEEVEGEIVDEPSAGYGQSEFDGHFDGDDIWDVNDDSSGQFDEGSEAGNEWSASEAAGDSSPMDSVGSVFSAEPVERSEDIVDEPDTPFDDGFAHSEDSPTSLFSSGGTVGGQVRFSAAGAPYFTPAGSSTSSGGLWESTDDPIASASRHREPLRSEPLWEPTDHSGDHLTSVSYPSQQDTGFGADEDSPGYEAAILKLHPQDREQASVALSVAGALLHEGERVVGVVTGQMLGRNAVVVVTSGRVLVVNDRRWQPVVDEYRIDSDLRVRGRHDRNIAALSFSNDWSLSMVDGITEVALAMDLAEQIRLIADS